MYVYTLARYCHWDEYFIVYELPLESGLKYYHCALWENGAWTVKAEDSKAKIKELTKWIDTRKTEEVQIDPEFEMYE